MRPDSSSLPLGHALVLGLVQGPTELLPISSSAHTTLLPWLLRWRYATLDGQLRKSFEVSLHAGAAAALALEMRSELLAAARRTSPRHAATVALSIVPPALAGLVLGPVIERRLGRPHTIAAGLIAGGLAMAASDERGELREREQAGPLDGLAIGLAQALALMPGVSRHGAAVSAARARGFTREAAGELSWHAGVPVMLGASALQGLRTSRRGLPAGALASLAAGALAAFGSTLASARAVRRMSRATRAGPLWPAAAYRLLLAALVLTRRRRTME
jgi:undecaprenyl-diphosphatase